MLEVHLGDSPKFGEFISGLIEALDGAFVPEGEKRARKALQNEFLWDVVERTLLKHGLGEAASRIKYDFRDVANEAISALYARTQPLSPEDFDVHSSDFAATVAGGLTRVGRGIDARQFLAEAFLLPNTNPKRHVSIAHAASRIGYKELHFRALQGAKGALDVKGLEAHEATRIALSVVDASRATLPELALSALQAAEHTVALVKDVATQSNLLKEIAAQWVKRGALARARIVAERAPLREPTMAAYREILKRINVQREELNRLRAAVQKRVPTNPSLLRPWHEGVP
jgi:hypothetical protein